MAKLDALDDEATVDRYNEEEQVTGFFVMIADNLAIPFETTVLGVTVTVEEIAACRPAAKLRLALVITRA